MAVYEPTAVTSTGASFLLRRSWQRERRSLTVQTLSQIQADVQLEGSVPWLNRFRAIVVGLPKIPTKPGL